MEPRTITIVGGTGFLGRYAVRRLARAGYRLRIIARRPDAALRLKTAGDVGQIVLMQGDITRPESLHGKLENSYAVINLVGILFESGRQKFAPVHTKGAETLAQLAKAARVERFIQVSALGADKASGSQYARSKLLGESAVLQAFPDATLLRPSVMFGPEDNFYNQFARMAVFSPALPLIGGGHTRFQPVYVDDVARAIETCLTRAEVRGHIYELGGPRIYTFREILDYILRVTGRHAKLMTLPYPAASLMGTMGELMPRPPLTRDQVKLLKFDNVVSPNARTFANLGIEPKAAEEIVPGYLARFAKLHAAA